MILWRISRHRDLSGAGGMRAAGRWHEAGRPVVYLAESPAAALLEVCVHTSANDVPPGVSGGISTICRRNGSAVTA
jgi:RES domain-containing protein